MPACFHPNPIKREHLMDRFGDQRIGNQLVDYRRLHPKNLQEWRVAIAASCINNLNLVCRFQRHRTTQIDFNLANRQRRTAHQACTQTPHRQPQQPHCDGATCTAIFVLGEKSWHWAENVRNRRIWEENIVKACTCIYDAGMS
jgi:hypothetical protein